MGLRLGAALWAATAVALAGSVAVGVARWCICSSTAAALTVVGVALWGMRRRRSPPRPLAVRLLGVVGVVGVALVLVSLVVAWRLAPLVDGPLRPLVGTRIAVTGEVLVSSDPACCDAAAPTTDPSPLPSALPPRRCTSDRPRPRRCPRG